MEDAHWGDLEAVQLTLGETSTTALEKLEAARDSHAESTVDLQLHLEDSEEKSCRNNLWLRGLPEAIGTTDLRETVLAIFHRVLDTAPPANWSWTECIEHWDLSHLTYTTTIARNLSSARHGRLG